MKKSIKQIANEVERYCDNELQGVDYGYCEDLQELKKELIHAVYNNYSGQYIEEKTGEIYDYIQMLKNENYDESED